jgi:hypothetical protein
MVESGLVKLTNQSFAEAGGKKAFPNLVMDAPVLGYGEGGEERVLENANRSLKEASIEHGYTHVFGIHYEVSAIEERSCSLGKWFECKAIGTGYKPREE